MVAQLCSIRSDGSGRDGYIVNQSHIKHGAREPSQGPWISQFRAPPKERQAVGGATWLCRSPVPIRTQTWAATASKRPLGDLVPMAAGAESALGVTEGTEKFLKRNGARHLESLKLRAAESDKRRTLNGSTKFLSASCPALPPGERQPVPWAPSGEPRPGEAVLGRMILAQTNSLRARHRRTKAQRESAFPSKEMVRPI
mmetsp:Transcript_89250/g.193178  ORF Transcript_89250/g.193178 Transcript_89250/m.193178 type:complete len:199 (+) Transcript_89250:74-670(+)